MRASPLVAMGSALWAGCAQAQDLPGDPDAGSRLAHEVCGVCHVVSDEQFVDPDVGAPTFYEVADDPAVTALSLRVFLRTPHATMPDLMLSPDETDDIIAYILSLRQD